MMTLYTLADLLAEALDFQDVYAGNIDGDLDSCIGVYNAKHPGPLQTAIGGDSCLRTREKRITILIHHTDDPTACEERALQVLEALRGLTGGGVRYIRPEVPQPVGRDQRGICEYVINAAVFYEEE